MNAKDATFIDITTQKGISWIRRSIRVQVCTEALSALSRPACPERHLKFLVGHGNRTCLVTLDTKWTFDSYGLVGGLRFASTIEASGRIITFAFIIVPVELPMTAEEREATFRTVVRRVNTDPCVN